MLVGFRVQFPPGILLAVLPPALLIISCKEQSTVSAGEDSSPARSEIEKLALPSRDGTAGEKLFTKISSEESGVKFRNTLVEDHAMSRLYFSGFSCGAVAMADFNGDGRQDLFFTGGAGKNGMFFQEDEALTFSEVTDTAGVSGGDSWSAGVLAVDLDGDTDIDLLLCNYDEAPHLFLNDGKGVFTESAKECGLTQVDAYLMPTVCDYDCDGDLDLFLVSNQYYREGGRPAKPPYEKGPDGRLKVKDEFAKYYSLKSNGRGGFQMDSTGRPDLLLRNDSNENGGLKFTDVTKEAGITESGFGLSATWWDFNNDGWPDLHVGNDFSDPDRLYHNLGNGRFVDIAKAAFPHVAWFSMGADVADVNGDGWDDLFCADMAFTTHYKQKVGMGQMGAKQAILERISPLQVMRNHLFINTGMGPFKEVGQMAGIAKSDWTWGVKFEDFDLDGRRDLFVANGAIRSFNHSDHTAAKGSQIGKTLWDLWKNTESRPEANLAFQNVGDLKFEKVAQEWGLDEVNVSHGVACGDLDGDGDADLVVTNNDDVVSIFRNDSEGSLIKVSLAGAGKNSQGVGAKVEVVVEGASQSGTIRPTGGYHTSAPAELIFGAGSAEIVDSLKVTWNDGSVQEFSDLATGHRYVISKSNAQSPEQVEPRSKGLFSIPAIVQGVTQGEAGFDDFAKQPLLPHKLSQLGRATAWADIDGDGDHDLFHGGSSGYPGGLFKNEGGKLLPVATPAFDQDKGFEDAAAAFFDADSDGDLDLYVASGSYENEVGSPQLQDRLYLNDGSGGLTRAADGALPSLLDVGSCVVANDIDRDGDLDLFVGSRVIPGQYPLPATSRLLINETVKGGAVKFVESDQSFEKLGMITDAIWADFNGDKIDDLAICQEWGPVRLFVNEEGMLIEKTEGSGMESVSGWWTRLAAADIDRDGDLDLVAGNFGLNTKYHASEEHPALLYYGDLVGDGKSSLIEAEYENEVLFPVRGKSCSTRAMPMLADKFKTFHAFAGSALDEIYSKPRIEAARMFSANTLESGYFVNQGNGKFEFRELPRLAQIAPIQGMVFGDFNQDGSLDLVVSQNFYNPQFETGPYAGGVGVLMAGDGNGGFSAILPQKSGVLLRGDPRGLDAVDLDGDGILDLVCPLNNGPMVWQKGLSGD